MPLLLQEGTLVARAAKMMQQEKVSALPVVSERGSGRVLIGILSECDVVRKVVAGNSVGLGMVTVGEIMSRRVKAVVSSAGRTRKQEVEICLSVMALNNFRHVPVVDANGNFLRMVDIVEAASEMFSESSPFLEMINQSAKKLLRYHWRTSGSIIKRNKSSSKADASAAAEEERPRLICLPTSATVVEAALALASEKASALLVSSRYGATGIISESDIVRRVVAMDLDPSKTVLSEVMTPNPHAILAGTDAKEALREMIKSRFRHIPVSSRDAKGFDMILDMLTLVRISLQQRGVRLNDESKLIISSSKQQTASASTLEQTVSPSMHEPPAAVESKKPLAGTVIEHQIKALKLVQASELEKAISEFGHAYGACTELDEGREMIAQVLSQRAAAYSALGELENALADYTAAYQALLGVEMPGENQVLFDEICVGRAETLIEMERYEVAAEALAEVKDATKLGPTFEMLVEERARIKEAGREFFKKDEITDAMNCFTNSLRVHHLLKNAPQCEKDFNRDGAILHCNRAATYIRVKDVGLALEDCFVALRLDSTYERITERLETIKQEFMNRDPQEWSAHLTSALVSSQVSQKPELVEIIQKLGLFSPAQGDENVNRNFQSEPNFVDPKTQIRNLGLFFAGQTA